MLPIFPNLTRKAYAILLKCTPILRGGCISLHARCFATFQMPGPLVWRCCAAGAVTRELCSRGRQTELRLRPLAVALMRSMELHMSSPGGGKPAWTGLSDEHTRRGR